ncbi:MAG: hydroxymethylglutaryl-CoA lyase [Alphaproteobacteria bacterium]
MSEQIEIVEVSLRDGLQNDPGRLSTDQKLEGLTRLLNAGCRRLEVASFVNPRRVPQMADSADVMARAPRGEGVRYIGLALNERGFWNALEAGCDEINFVVVATDTFGIKNQNATPRDSLDVLSEAMPAAKADGTPVSVTITAAFGCPFEGEVPAARVTDIAKEAAALGAEEIALGDTIGVADPWEMRRRIEAVRAVTEPARLRIHLHNTRNTALANAHAAVEAGVRVLDASCGGLGGCPFAPRATGNVATEDLVYMLHRGGLDTGLDLERLIETAKWFEEALGHSVPSMLSRAGPFPSAA